MCLLHQQFVSRMGAGTECLWYELCSRARKHSLTLSLERGRKQWGEPSVIGKDEAFGEVGLKGISLVANC